MCNTSKERTNPLHMLGAFPFQAILCRFSYICICIDLCGWLEHTKIVEESVRLIANFAYGNAIFSPTSSWKIGYVEPFLLKPSNKLTVYIHANKKLGVFTRALFGIPKTI